MTHTYAELGVSQPTYDEVRASLRAAKYDHAFMPDGAIDMHGIALVVDAELDPAGWLPIDRAPKDASIIWLGDASNIRLGWWAAGERYECRGTKGGGWRDFALAECGGRCDLQFTPTHWQAPPRPPVSRPGAPG